jgi:hypothetical protein
MRIIAQSDNWFVIRLDDNVTGRVFDLERRRLFAPLAIASILARGGWSDFHGDERPILDALNEAQDVTPERGNQPPLRPLAV